MLNKKFWAILISILVILISVLIIVFLPKLTDKDVVHIDDIEKELYPRVFINDILLNEDIDNLVLPKNEDIFFIIEEIDVDRVSVSLNGSLNVLFDEFYGKTTVENNKITFIPDFAISPGPHILEIKDLETNNIVASYKFIIVFREVFDIPLKDNFLWIIPNKAVEGWFAVSNNKLYITPKSSAGHASVSYLHKLEGNFSVNLELVPIGDNVSTVLYLIGPSRHSFVLGSNSDRFNFTFFTDKSDTDEIQGKDFLFKASERYHVRLIKEGPIISVLARELYDGDVVDYEYPEEKFTVLLENVARDAVYNFGVSVWQNSKGVKIGNVYIINYGFKE